MRFTPRPSAVVPLALAVAIAAYAADTTSEETITVQGTRATFTVPEGKVDRPAKPDLKLKLPAYQLNSLDFNFPSGLRMIFQADHSQPVVAVTMVVDRGSASDPIGKEGIAHFVEHLWFRSQHLDATDPEGKRRLPKIWDILTDLGCDLNASTSDDWTNYMSVCPATSLPALIRLESLRIQEPVEGAIEAGVETEREVIRNELRMRYENDDFGNALPFLFGKLYPDDHPYHRLGIGTHESLANCHLPDIQAFTKKNYTPENTTITIVGDFNLDDVSRLVAENMDPRNLVDPKNPDAPLKLRDNPPKRVDPSVPAAEPPPPKDQTLGVYEANVEQPLVIVAWTVPGAYRGHDANYQLAAGFAGNVMNQYFSDNDARVDSDGVGCFLWDSKVDSKVLCGIPLKKGVDVEKVDADQIAQRAADQVALLWNPDVMQPEFLDGLLERIKMERLADILRSLDLFATVGGGRATDIAHHAHFTGSYTAHSDQMTETMSLARQEIIDTAYKYLRRERMVEVFLKPIPEDELAKDNSAGSDYVAAQGDDNVVRSTIQPEDITPEVIKDFTITPRTDLIREKTLDNGLRVVVLEHGEAPLVETGLFVNGGSLTSTPVGLDEFSEDFVETLWNNRSSRKTDTLRIAGTWDANRAEGFTYRSLESASGNLDGALWFMREAVEELTPNLDGRATYVSDMKGAIKKGWKERSSYIAAVGAHHWWGDHPIAHFETTAAAWEIPVAISEIPGADTVAHMRAKYQPANSTLLVVGNVNGEQALKLAEYYFQGWKPGKDVVVGKQPDLAPPVGVTDPVELLVYDHEKRTQTDVSWSCPVNAGKPTDDALRNVLGDYIDELAWIILRENGGVTYGANGYVFGQPNGMAGLGMESLVQNDGVVMAIHAFQDIAHQVETGDIKLDRLKVQALNRGKKYVNRQQSVPQMIGRLMGPLVWHQPWSFVDGYADRLAAVTPKDLQTAMGDCSKHSVITLDGPKVELLPMLDGAKIEYKLVDIKEERHKLYETYDPKNYAKMLKAEAKSEAAKAKEEAKKAAVPAPEPTPAPAPAPEPAPKASDGSFFTM
jgi:predicted Zn-dependent peptidase